MGVAGAALATVISQAVSGSGYLRFNELQRYVLPETKGKFIFINSCFCPLLLLVFLLEFSLSCIIFPI